MSKVEHQHDFDAASGADEEDREHRNGLTPEQRAEWATYAKDWRWNAPDWARNAILRLNAEVDRLTAALAAPDTELVELTAEREWLYAGLEQRTRERDEARAALEALRPTEGEVLVRADFVAKHHIAALTRVRIGLSCLWISDSAIVTFPPAAGAEKEPGHVG